jgi:CHAT domain-containing protein
MLAGRTPGLAGADERMQLAEMLRVRAELERRQRESVGGGTTADPEFERTYREYDQKLEALRKTAPKVVDLYQPSSIRLKELQALAGADGSDILQYLVADSGVVIWHVGASSTKAVRVLLAQEQLKQKVGALLASARDPRASFDAETAHELYLFLISPVADQIHSKHLVILPGELGLLPFAMLQRTADGAALGEEFQISMAPSAGLLAQLSRTDRLGAARIASVVNTSLPGARNEARTLSTMYARHTVLEDPDRATLIRTLGGYDAVNFATHGAFSADGPMLARLQLRARDEESITAAESFALPLRGTKVVTLGACETGRGRSGARAHVLESPGRSFGALPHHVLSGGQDGASERGRPTGASRRESPKSAPERVGRIPLRGPMNGEKVGLESAAKGAAAAIAVAVSLVYLCGYLALRQQITTLGIPAEFSVFDERYLYAGAGYLVFLAQALAEMGLVALPAAALVVVARLLVLRRRGIWKKGWEAPELLPRLECRSKGIALSLSRRWRLSGRYGRSLRRGLGPTCMTCYTRPASTRRWRVCWRETARSNTRSSKGTSPSLSCACY